MSVFARPWSLSTGLGATSPSCKIGRLDCEPEMVDPGKAREVLERLAEQPGAGAQPGWALESWTAGRGGAVPSAAQCEELRDIVDAEEMADVEAVEARLAGLALLWLSTAQQLGDLDRAARWLDREETIGPLFSEMQSQSLTAMPTRVAATRTLGDAARLAAQRITGQRFATAEAYRRWRAESPEPSGALSYWTQLLSNTSASRAREELAALEPSRPHLWRRVVMSLIDRSPHASDDDRLRAMAGLEPQQTLALLDQEAGWPEHASAEAHATFAGWVFEHWEALFGAERDDALWRRWTDEARPSKPARVQIGMALAVAQRMPSRGADVLRQALALGHGPEVASVLHALAEYHLDATTDLLRDRFFTEDADSERVAILEGLAEARIDAGRARALLSELAAHDAEALEVPQTLAALSRAVAAHGGPCRGHSMAELRAPSKAVDAGSWRAAAEKAAGVRLALLDAIQGWLQTSPKR